MTDQATDPLGRIIATRRPAVVVDVGAGHGTSLSWLIESAPAGALLIAVDVAVPPASPPDRVRYVRADAARLPLGDRCAPTWWRAAARRSRTPASTRTWWPRR